MLAFAAGILFVIAAVLAWVGAGHVLVVALAAAACLAFHFGLLGLFIHARGPAHQAPPPPPTPPAKQ